MVVVGVGAGALHVAFPSQALAIAQLVAGGAALALSLTRSHPLWPMGSLVALALMVIGGHRLELLVHPPPAPQLVEQTRTVVQAPAARR